MGTIDVTQLGLAAYIKMQGAKLLHVADKKFTFESERTLEAWRIDYNNSCCMKHDSVVCELRRFLKG